MSQKEQEKFWLTIKKTVINQRQNPSIKPVFQDNNLKIPLSYNQEQLWQLNRLNINSVHNIANALRFTTKLNFIALEKSLQEIVRRHAILRTTFPLVNGKPIQNVTSEINFQVPILDVRKLPKTEQEKQAKQIAAREQERPFDLTKEPAFRVKLLCLADDKSILLLTMHHLIFDGVSFGILFQELKLLYEAFADHQPNPLTELSIQYADFACWQRKLLENTRDNSLINYWKEQLRGEIEALKLPQDSNKNYALNYQGRSHSFQLSSALSKNLKTLSIEQGVTLFTTLLTAFKILLHCYSKQEDIILVSPIAGRDRPETKNLIGYFNNLLVLRNNFNDNLTFLELLERVNETVLKAREHQDMPFKKLTEFSNLARTPLSRAMFALSNYKMQSLKLSEIVPTTLDLRGIQQETSNFDLSLSMSDRPEQIAGIIRYKTKLFKQETISKLKSNFISLLELIIFNPNIYLQDLPYFENPDQTNIDFVSNQQKYDKIFIAPRSELERKIRNIWQKILAIEAISIRDNFFDLGGHSLTSIKLMLELEKAFQQKLPWSIFSQLTNIEEQASLISQEGFASTREKVRSHKTIATIARETVHFSPTIPDQEYRQLLALTSGWKAQRMKNKGLTIGLNTNGSKPPFFWSAGAFREIAPLTKHFPQEQPIYGLFNGYGVLQPTSKNIEALAAHYVSEILAIQSQEPYYLGGYCLGGLVAFAIAEQLQKQGKKVALLVLVDSYIPRNYSDSLTLIFGRESYKNPYRLQPPIAIDWHQQFRNGLEVYLVAGNHRLLDDYLIAETAAKIRFCLENTQNNPNKTTSLSTINSQSSPSNLVDVRANLFRADKRLSASCEASPKDSPASADRKLRDSPVISPYKAKIKTLSKTVAPTGTTLIIPISIKNLSPIRWSSESILINLSLVNRWLNQKGEFIPWDDNRIHLPQPIQPNSEVEVSLTVTTPLTPGFYSLELGLTQFGLTWLEIEGAKRTIITVEVTKNESSSYQAQIITQKELKIAVGTTVILPVSVQNISPYPWLCSEESPVRLIGNWFDENGQAISWNDSDRGIKLPKYIQAQEITKLDLPLTAPLKSGHYYLQLDLGQFGTLWFKSQNLPMTTVKVEVTEQEGSSCRAVISAQKHLKMAVGEIAKIPVKVKNSSSLTWLWERHSHIYLGNHWLEQNRKVVRWNDGLSELPRNLSPQEEIELFLNVTAPLKPATYSLEIDLWQKGITWFQQQGSQTTIVEVEVREVKGSAFRAQITTQKHLQVAVGKTFKIPVKVKNLSTVTWQSSPENLIQLGNHWLDAQGHKVIKWDDGRTTLVNSLQPQQEVELFLSVTAPLSSNNYLLELDLVQEGLTWFKQQESPTTIVEVEVIKETIPAYKAQLITPNFLQKRTKEIVTIPVKVKNISALTWKFNQQKYFQLGNHWLDANKNIIQWDDSKKRLPKSLSPNEEIELQLSLTMPDLAGLYFLELDIVQKGVTWFQRQGSQTMMVKVEVI